MSVTQELDELAREFGLEGDEKARRFAKSVAIWAVRETHGQASIVDYEREEFEKRVAWLVGEIEKA